MEACRILRPLRGGRLRTFSSAYRPDGASVSRRQRRRVTLSTTLVLQANREDLLPARHKVASKLEHERRYLAVKNRQRRSAQIEAKLREVSIAAKRYLVGRTGKKTERHKILEEANAVNQNRRRLQTTQ